MRRAATGIAVLGVAMSVASAASGAPTDAQLAGQHITWPIDGTTVSARMRAGIRRGEVGSVILFARNAPSRTALGRLTASLQSVQRPAGLDAPLLITIDQEGGLVKRLPWAPPAMSAARMGARLTASGIRAQGAATGRALLASGVNADLAPVCDVAVPGRSIARDGRAFGSTAAGVARDCTAFARGLADAGAAAAAKHFPGLGRARVNTDDAPVRITASRAALERDLVPFRAAIGAGVPMVMVSSAIFTALSPRPAMLAAPVVTGLLRRDLGFRGVTISDAIDTPALRPWGGLRAGAGAAAAAGMDLVIVAGTEADAARAQRGVADAIAAGRLSRAEARASVGRVLALRRSIRP